jgi:asparagine synthase (glutamine-hydrolysing)
VTTAGPVPALSLATLGIRTAFQQKGVGSALTLQGLLECTWLGHRIVICVGHPQFYQRFGFVPARASGLELPFPAPDEVFLVRELVPDAMKRITGLVRYPDARWGLMHDDVYPSGKIHLRRSRFSGRDPGMCVIQGWVEVNGRRLQYDEITDVCTNSPAEMAHFGGEFYISGGGCQARDRYGIIPGPVPKGTVFCRDYPRVPVKPDPPSVGLEEAIIQSVSLRSDEGVTALSGGVDSSLVARLAGLPCVVVGTAGAHDLKQAETAAGVLGLQCEQVILTTAHIEDALTTVLGLIPDRTPVHASIATTLYCVAEWASNRGYRRVLTGQGADELFGGYARYLSTPTLEADLSRDFLELEKQAARDQAVAGAHNIWFSYPYLDTRVVRAAKTIPAEEKVYRGVRKWALRTVAERYIPKNIAWYDKKAMQYGSGVWNVIRDLARHNGYKRSVQGYINQISEREHGNRAGR